MNSFGPYDDPLNSENSFFDKKVVLNKNTYISIQGKSEKKKW